MSEPTHPPLVNAAPPFSLPPPQAVGEVISGLAQGNMATVPPKLRVAAAERWISLEHVRKVRGEQQQ